jgi:membrane protein
MTPTDTPGTTPPPVDNQANVGGRRWEVLWWAVRRPRWFFGGLVSRIGEDSLSSFAAALAYYFLFSLFPFLLFLLALVTMLPFVHGLEDWLLAQAGQVVPGDAYTMIEGVLGSLLAQPRSGLLSLGAVLALWSASTAVTGVMGALNVAYGVPERRRWWTVRLIAIGLVVAMSFFMILAFVLAVSSGPLAAWVAGMLGAAGAVALLVANWLVVLAAITLVIATIYHVCPDVDFPWRWFSPGSVLFTLGFAATTLGFSYYVTHFGTYDKTYGSLGAVIILLLWMYFVAFLLLLGGEVNAYLDRTAAELDRERAAVIAARTAEPPDPDLPRWAFEDSDAGG